MTLAEEVREGQERYKEAGKVVEEVDDSFHDECIDHIDLDKKKDSGNHI